MRFSRNATVSHPAAVVLETMIHRMEAIVPFLPNVASIATVRRENLPEGRLCIVRRWQGTLGSVPAPLRPFLSVEWLGWTDMAVWTPAAYKVEWTHSPAVSRLAAFYDCHGTNYFEPDPRDPHDTTSIRINGDLTVYPRALPGMPGFLADRLAPQVEKFVINLVTPNLTDLAQGLQRYLDRHSHAEAPARRAGGSR
jgi:hypothetical protein